MRDHLDEDTKTKMIQEIKKLQKSLLWALKEIDDLSEGFTDNGTPKHLCTFQYAPDQGYCEFCDNYWQAAFNSGRKINEPE